ncbi:hypothetical protein DM01DRAFT_1340014 [Hesseltinella vesiculosa]|uniref:DNA 3'-5' helicase n=1 Tax=Hesseltinella vesiculosa TaxID=101127 RepID=A0A1X2G5D3_9FUNG|nr:hypothetical protein DM01DRAFT_1340014 [Hesseltinella vesiculosa]
MIVFISSKSSNTCQVSSSALYPDLFYFLTSAFGAGIDYPKVAAVIHDQLSYGLVDFVQESGRAGRSGAHSTVIPPLSTPPLASALLLVLQHQRNQQGYAVYNL